ncbi:MAG: GNAT family N-acetyltransferase [Muribaculaceae bacterium]|nr:GNAT family N-acetyltransferase [Muribaculaceae bacterium]
MDSIVNAGKPEGGHEADDVRNSEIVLKRYTHEMKREWDKFVADSRNGTFLFHRDYMDYHGDRFRDHSLMAYKGNSLMALLPANEVSEENGKKLLQSHGGLTYGGWICGARHPDANEMLRIFGLLVDYGKENGFSEIDYKPIPWIYSRRPSQEDLYALFRYGAKLTESNISAVIDLADNPGFNTRQRRYLKRARRVTDVEMVEKDASAEFHKLLTECLQERYGATPVHTADELQLLKSRFPAQIRIFMLRDEEGWQAGVCVFDCGQTVHCQYICSTLRAREEGLLTRLFSYLIEDVFYDRRYFDFGTSNEQHGLVLNASLYRQKHGLGGTGILYPRYTLTIL